MQQQATSPDDPNADAIRQGLLTRMGQRSPNTGINGGATTQQGSTPGVDGNPPAPPQPGPTAPTAPPAAPAATPQPFDRTAFRDAINGAPDANAVLQQYGLTADKAGRTTLPTGEIMDVIQGAGAGGTKGQWMGVGEMGANGQASMYAPAVGAGGSASGALGGAMGGGFQDLIRQQLLAKLQSANGPVDEHASEIAQPMQAAQLEASRGQDVERKALAERAYAQGGGNPDQAAITQGVQQSAERNAVSLAGIKSQLISKVYEGKRQDAQQALQLAVQSGDAEAARQAQMQIAQMDNEIKRLGLSQQQSQFNDNYGLNVNDAQYQRDRDAARAKAGLPF